MAKRKKPLQGRLTLPRQVRDDEQKYIDQRRRKAKVAPDAPLVGLGLSGGGIRSATFCLGVLQGLAEKGVIRLVDYLSTVSGGGYLGACLTSLTTVLPEEELRERRRRRAIRDWRTLGRWEEPGGRKSSFNTAFSKSSRMPLRDPDQIQHLRKHGDFLVLGRAMYRREIVRAAGAFVVGWSALMALLLSVLVTLVGAYYGYFWVFNGGSLWSYLGGSRWPQWSVVLRFLHPDLISCGWTLAAGALFGTVAWVYGFFFFLSRPASRSGETREDLGERKRLTCFGVNMAVAMAAVGLAVHALRPRYDTMLSGLWLPVAFALGALLATGGLYLVVCTLFSGRWSRSKRSVFGGMQGICTYYLLGTIALLGFTLLVWWLDPFTVRRAATAAAALAGNFGLIQVLSKMQKRSQPRGVWVTVVAVITRLVLALAVLAFIALASLICAKALLQLGGAGFWIMAAAPPAFVVLGYAININRISLHYFYRDRLVETYLRTEASGANGLEIVRDDELLKLTDLHDRFVNNRQAAGAANSAPYHLILCALNLAGSRDLARKDRKSDHFIFSKRYCGSTTTGYVPTERYRHGQTKLCTAMTISGAAASTGMGAKTSFFTAFALALLNVRLGYWLLNPRQFEPIYPETAVPPRPERFMWWRKNSYDELGTFWPACLFREMFAATNARSRLVYLSDGGHTGDNLGLYPLLQRRCKLIIVCDAESDGGYTFSSFAAAVQQIFADENVRVEINLDDVRPQPNSGVSRKHVAVGRIHYPDCRGANPGHPDVSADTGWLIYIKSSLSGQDDPTVVGSYAQRHADFPHETTADQFFDDAQFEAYRALGYHAGEEAATKAMIDVQVGGHRVQTLRDWAGAWKKPSPPRPPRPRAKKATPPKPPGPRAKKATPAKPRKRPAKKTKRKKGP